MSLLFIGVAIWAFVHFISVLTPKLKTKVVARIGAAAYKGLSALAILSGAVFIVLGWKVGSTELLYDLGISQMITVALMFLVVLVLSASIMPTNIKRYIRHPQLVSVKLWAVAHLLVNGSGRDVVLFGGLLAWAVIMMIGSNKRDGEWVKPDAVSYAKDGIVVVVALVIFVIFMRFHVYFAGVSLMH